jgi:hypothetical protein
MLVESVSPVEATAPDAAFFAVPPVACVALALVTLRVVDMCKAKCMPSQGSANGYPGEANKTAHENSYKCELC